MSKVSNGIELNDFVAESLKQIIEGIIEAQKFAKEKGAIVNPKNIVGNSPEDY